MRVTALFHPQTAFFLQDYLERLRPDLLH